MEDWIHEKHFAVLLITSSKSIELFHPRWEGSLHFVCHLENVDHFKENSARWYILTTRRKHDADWCLKGLA
jgi:hypothetical protein